MSAPTAPEYPVYRTGADAPRLENWISVAEAQQILGVGARQTVSRMVFESGQLQHARKIGEHDQPMLLLLEKEVRQLAGLRENNGPVPRFRKAAAGQEPAFANMDEVPKLKDWVPMPAAAPYLGLETKTGVHRLVFVSHRLQHVRRVGIPPRIVVLLYVPELVALGEVRELEAKDSAASLERTKARLARRAFHQRVREWVAETTGRPFTVFARVSDEQISAYKAAHPDDQGV